jgi:hypothetical protein
MDDAKLMVVGTYSTRSEADLAHGALEAADIEAVLSADDAGGLQPALGFGSGIRLLVRAEDLERATSILTCEPDDSGQ